MSSIVNGQVPTTPPLKTYGNIVVSGNGLLLEDESAYLNAGDFQGNLYNFCFFTHFVHSIVLCSLMILDRFILFNCFSMEAELFKTLFSTL